jgi:hypothetical protein
MQQETELFIQYNVFLYDLAIRHSHMPNNHWRLSALVVQLAL